MNGEAVDCDEVIEHIFDYLDGELDETLDARIARHLEHCRDCFTRAEFERKLQQKVRDAGSVRAPDRLHRRVREIMDRF